MRRLAKISILTRLIDAMRERGSWCGETHVQKAAVFLQDLLKVPLGFEFVLYKHGPFSFELRDELTAMRADEFFKLEPQRPYGPRIVLTDRSDYIQKKFPRTIRKYQRKIDFVADVVEKKGVLELERLATALFISLHQYPSGSVDIRASELTRVKPHISRENAQSAVRDVDKIMSRAPS
jgi:uncharacterized protein YwgA